MVTAALFTMSKTWTQARCTSTDKEIKEDVVYLYNGTLVIKKNKIMTFATTQIDLDIIILSEANQREK